MILADTSIVIEFSRTRAPRLRAIIRTYDAAVCGVTRAEFLYGALNPGHRRNLIRTLAMFIHVPIPDSIWDDVGDHLAALRGSGVTVPFQDVVIATVAIVNDIELWTRDSQFKLMQPVLPRLRLFVEPP